MAQILPVVCLILGLLSGGIIAWFVCQIRAAKVCQQKTAELSLRLAVSEERFQNQSAALAGLNTEKTALQQQSEQWRLSCQQSSERIAQLETILEKERSEFVQRVALLDEAEKKLKDAFQSLAAETLKANNQSFLDLAKTTLETHQQVAKGDLEKRQEAIAALVAPVSESIKNVDTKIGELEKARAQAYGGLHQQLVSLVATEEKLRQETSNLVRALRMPVTRGRWGELQLKRVVEMAGMIDHCDFYEQESTDTEEGRLRPDLRIRLPGSCNIIVDAKVPLLAFLEAVEATDDQVRAAKMRDYSRHLATHIEQLSKKAYWDQFQPSPEFVILFLPGEHFYTAALESQPDLIERGFEQRVVIATPMTLISLLRAVAIGWRHERLAENAEEISKLGKELYERLCKMAEHITKLGRSLNQSVEAFNQTVGALDTRVIVSARRFRELGAAVADEIESPDVIDKVPRSLQALDFCNDATGSGGTASHRPLFAAVRPKS